MKTFDENFKFLGPSFQAYSQIAGNGWQLRRTSETHGSNEGYTRATAMLWNASSTSLENLRPPPAPAANTQDQGDKA